MTDIVARQSGHLVRGLSLGPAEDFNSIDLTPVTAWSNLDEVPAEVVQQLRSQNLYPKDLLTSGTRAPVVVPAKGGGLSEEAGGWLVGSDCLVQFDAYRPHVDGQSAGAGWTVTGERRDFSPAALIRFASVPQDSGEEQASRQQSGSSVAMPLGLEMAELLPATARLKLLSVPSPTLADSYMLRLDRIPGLTYVQLLAMAANEHVCVAALARLEVHAHQSATPESVQSQLAREPWRLGILRGQFT